jgi:DNA uptake protein ComE-like DNA-binding protein
MDIVNINKASEKDLQKIKGVGKIRAKSIVNNRPFRDLCELSKIAGLGKKRMDVIIQQDILIQI